MPKRSNSRKGAESVLRDLVKIAYARGAQDALPKQFEREQYAGPGEDDQPRFPAVDNFPALAEVCAKLGLSPEQTEQCCRAAGEDQDISCDADDPDIKLRAFLEANGTLSEDEVETAIKLANKDRAGKTAAEDEPPPFSGRPRPGGGMDPIRNSATGARDAALANVRRIGIDNSVGTQHFTPAVNPPGRVLASDHTSTRSMAGFAERWPGAARIKQAI